jgi:pimeloyl-ACP methyl ester carboxylesterase/nicotinamidase-related amidase
MSKLNSTFELRRAHLDTGAITLDYRDYRPAGGNAPVVVLLHGAMCRGASWDRLAQALAIAGYRVLAPDQRGHGWSSKPPATLASYDRDAYVGDLERFLDALGVGRCALIGHSTGALNALVYAARHPDRVGAMVLEEHGVTPRGPEYLDEWRSWLGSWPKRFSSIGAIRAHFGRERPGYADHFSELFEEVEDGWRPLCDHEVVLCTIAGNHSRAWWPELAAVACPTLVVKGEDSDLPQGEVLRMANTLRQGELWVASGAGHVVHDECPATFLAACLRLLRAHLPAAGRGGDLELAQLVEQQYETGDVGVPVGAERAALVIIDMQEEFVSPGHGPFHVPDAAARVPAIARLLAACRARGVPVIHTAFAETHGGLDRPRHGARMPNRFSELRGQLDATLFREARFVTELKPAAGETLLLKPSYGAFTDTPLETILKRLGRDTVLLAGTLTNYCVGTTARQAYERGLLAVVASDACATDSTRAHVEELRVLRRGFARVATVDRIIAELDAPATPATICA